MDDVNAGRKPANGNPWYVLMTLYGEQDGEEINGDLALRNREAWNAWSCQEMTYDEQLEVAKRNAVPVAELQSWGHLQTELVSLHEAEMRRRNGEGFQYSGLPKVAKELDLTDVEFDHRLVMFNTVFSGAANFARASFRREVHFDFATFVKDASFASATFNEYASFVANSFSGNANFDCVALRNGVGFFNAVFSGRATYDSAAFSGEVNFSFAKFENAVRFSNDTFDGETWFSGAEFKVEALMASSTFSGPAYFNGTVFNGAALFDSSEFRETTQFGSGKFMGKTRFSFAKFNKDAWFSGATFSGAVTFESAKFNGDGWFRSAIFLGDVSFLSVTFDGAAKFESVVFYGTTKFDAAGFGGFTYFNEAQFGTLEGAQTVSFADSQLLKPTNFRGAIFHSKYPDFSGAVLHEKTMFADKDDNWPKYPQENPEQAKASCAAIRHNLGKQGLPEQEHFFYRREMGFATQIGGLGQRLPYLLFKWFSGYGYSIALPLIWLGVLWAFGVAAFAGYFMQQSIEVALGKAMGLSFSNLFPVFGFGRLYFDAEFMKPLPAVLKVVASGQTVLALPLLFFLGLGLRNRFRLR